MTLAGLGEFRFPLSVTTVEDQNGVAGIEPQHIAQVVGLVTAQGERRAFAKIGLHEQALGVEIIPGHIAILLHPGSRAATILSGGSLTPALVHGSLRL